jgi:hypothetical protein
MADNDELVTVFRSADSTAMDDAQEIVEILKGQQIEARIFDDDTPEVISGSVEVRVPAALAEKAEQVLTAEPVEGDLADSDPSALLDPVTVWQGTGTTAEMEAETVESVLRAAGIQSIRVGSTTMPILPFEIQVAREHADAARQIIEEALASGPEAADEAAG